MAIQYLKSARSAADIAEDDGKIRASVEATLIARYIFDQPAMDAHRAHEMNPGPTVASDEAWLDFARRNGQQTICHAIGTCKIKMRAAERSRCPRSLWSR